MTATQITTSKVSGKKTNSETQRQDSGEQTVVNNQALATCYSNKIHTKPRKKKKNTQKTEKKKQAKKKKKKKEREKKKKPGTSIRGSGMGQPMWVMNSVTPKNTIMKLAQKKNVWNTPNFDRQLLASLEKNHIRQVRKKSGNERRTAFY